MDYVQVLERQAEDRRANERYMSYDTPERPDYNPKERRYALSNLLEFIEGDIECLTDYVKSVSPEKQQVAREYDGLLAELRKYAELLENDRFEADYEYHKDQNYWDSLD